MHFYSDTFTLIQPTFTPTTILLVNPFSIAPQFACRNKKTTVALSSVHFHSSHNSFDKKAGKLKGTFTLTQLTFTRTIFLMENRKQLLLFHLSTSTQPTIPLRRKKPSPFSLSHFHFHSTHFHSPQSSFSDGKQ